MDRTERQDDSAVSAPSAETTGAYLRIVFGRAPGALFAFGPSGVTIGRAAQPNEPSVELADARTSRRHVTVARHGGIWRITDLGSRNGGFVDGARFSSGEALDLADGAVLRLGDSLLVFRDGPPPVEDDGPVAAFPGVSPEACRVRARLSKLAEASGHVLIEGETGTGKERVARALATRPGETVAINCAELSRELGRAELFGHARGAFSGATTAREGLVDRARGGTLFLDEIGELDLDTQADLLRFLEDGGYRPIGSTEIRTSTARVVAATNVVLEEAVLQGRFRRDLLARLRSSNAPLELPPLRERREDILPWAEAFLREALDDPSAALEITAGAAECLLLYPWPENLRELRGVIRTLGREQSGPVAAADLPERIRNHRAAGRIRPVASSSPGGESGREPQREPSRDEIESALRASGGRVRVAAERLGVERRKLYRLCDRLGIDLDAHRQGQ